MKALWPFRRRKAPVRLPEGDGLPRIAVLGTLRSGTNLVRRLVETHWQVTADFSPYGWKHAGVPIFSPDSGFRYPGVPILYVVKNPHACMLSLYRYRMLAKTRGHRISIEGEDTLERFLTSPVTVYDSQLPGSPRLRFANPVQYWNFVNCNLELLEAPAFAVRGINYDDLIADPESLRVVEDFGPFARRRAVIRLPDAPMRRDTDATMMRSQSDESFSADYYTERRYLNDLTAEQIAFISDQADGWLMTRRGFQRF